MHYVYILQSATGKKYIGCTQNLKNRIAEHKAGETKSTKDDAYILKWYCCFHNKTKAYKFEKYLKSSSGYAFTNKHLV